MTKPIIIAAVIGFVVLGAGAVLLLQNRTPDQNQQQTEQPGQDKQVIAPLSTSVNLVSQNNSGESGVATLVALEGGKTKVTLNLTNAPANIAQPAHIHRGSCANLGEVLFPLTPPVNGQSETTLDVALAEGILNRLPLAVNVHKSESEINIYYACGDIGTTVPLVSPNPANSPTVTVNPTNTPTAFPSQSPEDRRRGSDKPED